MVRSEKDTLNERPADRRDPAASLYFFPDQEVTEAQAQALLQGDSPEERAWVISHLLRFAQWDDIWSYVTRDEVRDIFPHLELPDNLRSAWGRMLKISVPVA